MRTLLLTIWHWNNVQMLPQKLQICRCHKVDSTVTSSTRLLTDIITFSNQKCQQICTPFIINIISSGQFPKSAFNVWWYRMTKYDNWNSNLLAFILFLFNLKIVKQASVTCHSNCFGYMNFIVKLLFFCKNIYATK